MCGVQGYVRLLWRQTWLLEPRAQGSKATHLAGTAGSVVGHHGASAQVPWYRYDHTHHIIWTWWAVETPLKVFLFSAVAVRGSRGEAHLSDVEGNGPQPSESLSGDTRVTRMIWLDGIISSHCTYFSPAEVSLFISSMFFFIWLDGRRERWEVSGLWYRGWWLSWTDNMGAFGLLKTAQTSAILLLICSPCWSSCWCLTSTTCPSKHLYPSKHCIDKAFCGAYCTIFSSIVLCTYY